MKSLSVTIKNKAIKQYFLWCCFLKYTEALACESVDEILTYDHSNFPCCIFVFFLKKRRFPNLVCAAHFSDRQCSQLRCYSRTTLLRSRRLCLSRGRSQGYISEHRLAPSQWRAAGIVVYIPWKWRPSNTRNSSDPRNVPLVERQQRTAPHPCSPHGVWRRYSFP